MNTKQEVNELCTFIGGPHDGKRLAIPVDKFRIMLPPAPGVYYRGELLAAEKTQIRVFVIDSMTTAAALARLIEHYKPE